MFFESRNGPTFRYEKDSFTQNAQLLNRSERPINQCDFWFPAFKTGYLSATFIITMFITANMAESKWREQENNDSDYSTEKHCLFPLNAISLRNPVESFDQLNLSNDLIVRVLFVSRLNGLSLFAETRITRVTSVCITSRNISWIKGRGQFSLLLLGTAWRGCFL